MANKQSLSNLMRQRVEKASKDNDALSQDARNALQLAEQFEGITPPDYLLPIDEMAGFATQRC